MKRTNHNPVASLQFEIAVKPIEDSWDGRSPHQYDNTEIIQLVTQYGDGFAVVVDDVETGPRANRISSYWKLTSRVQICMYMDI